MWLIGTKGIFSIVAHRDDKDQLLVRSRSEEDIDYFKSVMDELGLEPLSSKVYGEKFDYPWRYFCRKEDVDIIVAKLTDEIDYTNFKSAAPHDRSAVLFKVYNALLGLDDRDRISSVGTSFSPLRHDPIPTTPLAPSLSGITDIMEGTDDDDLDAVYDDRVIELEAALENIAYTIEGKGPVGSRRAKLRLVDALARKALGTDNVLDVFGPKVQRQVEQVEREEDE